MKKIKQIIGGSVLLLYFPVVLSFVAVSKKQVVCGKIQTEICDSVSNAFISADELRTIALEKYPGILGRAVDELDTEEMEVFFEKHPAINKCEVFYTMGGTLHFKIEQKVPVLRVFNGNSSYYFDEEGQKMPVFYNHSAHILVANGHIKRLKKEGDLVEMAFYIHKDPFWKAQIEQVYVNEKAEFILIPRVGDHIVEFGKIENMTTKFKNLKALYQYGWDAREWNMYRKVSLKYNGQIVCSKAN